MKLPRVISKFLCPLTEKITTFLDMMKVDRLTDLRNGPISDRVEKQVLPVWNKLFRQNAKELDQDLVSLENKYCERITVAKSIYSYKMLCEQYEHYRRSLVETFYENHFDVFTEAHELAWPKSKSFKFDTTGLDLTKGSGYPMMGPKRLQLYPASQYANKIKADPSTPAYGYLPGIRTQIGKTRGIWQDPISEWYLEIEACRDAIQKAVEIAQAPKVHNEIQLHYCTPEVIQKFLFQDGFTCIVVLDYTQYDSTLVAAEIADFLYGIAADHPAIDHIVDHAIRAPIMMPDRKPLERFGGLASGKVFTNYLGGEKNAEGGFKVWKDLKLDKYIRRASFNGDDNAWVFDTILNNKNLESFGSKCKPRNLEPDKCTISTKSAWYSKVLYTDKYYCKPGYLVLHSIIHREQEATPDALSRAYVAISIAQKCEWLRMHPLGEKLVKMIKAVDKHSVETLDDSELKPAMEAYRRSHSYMEEAGQLGELEQVVEHGFYASL